MRSTTVKNGRSICISFPRLALTLFVIAAFVQPVVAKSKDDVVVMKNGDRFTGEIKGLQRGELSFKAKYMADPVRLDWAEVERLESQDAFLVALTNGRRYVGQIEPGTDLAEGDFQIAINHSTVLVKQQDVIAIQQQEGTFWKQLTGSIDYGFSYAGDNRQTTSSLSAGVAYHARVDTVQIGTTSQFNGQSAGPTTSRFTFTGQYDRKLDRDWFAAGFFDLLKSDQQELNLRTTYGGGLGRTLKQTDRTSLGMLGGLVYTHEGYFPQPGIDPIRNNAESFLGLRFTTFRFKTLDLNSQSLAFPSLSDPGRVRLSSQSDLRVEVVKNFYWSFRLYENFDSRPPVTAPRNDLGITTSLGWKF